MNEILRDTLLDKLSEYSNVIKLIASGGKVIKKVTARPLILKGEVKWQVETVVDNKASHNNITIEELIALLVGDSMQEFKQINILMSDKDVNILVSSQGKIHTKSTAVAGRAKPQLGHNREKKYLLEEGMAIQPMVDLKIFTADYRIIKDKFDKFRQINKFIEIIDQEVKNIEGKSFKIMDFGCGKSYLTFLVYYYFKVIRNVDVEVIGYDLKSDVVANCNDIAARYGYDKLHFIVGDLSQLKAGNHDVDMTISLHACDTATDYALYYSIAADVKYIFAVPCCQHQVNSCISGGGELAPLLADGLFKERFSALLTDSIRAELLRANGYEVDVIEFVDLSHSPKNIMLRAKLVDKIPSPDYNSTREVMSKFNIEQCLYSLLNQ